MDIVGNDFTRFFYDSFGSRQTSIDIEFNLVLLFNEVIDIFFIEAYKYKDNAYELDRVLKSIHTRSYTPKSKSMIEYNEQNEIVGIDNSSIIDKIVIINVKSGFLITTVGYYFGSTMYHKKIMEMMENYYSDQVYLKQFRDILGYNFPLISTINIDDVPFEEEDLNLDRYFYIAFYFNNAPDYEFLLFQSKYSSEKEYLSLVDRFKTYAQAIESYRGNLVTLSMHIWKVNYHQIKFEMKNGLFTRVNKLVSKKDKLTQKMLDANYN